MLDLAERTRRLSTTKASAPLDYLEFDLTPNFISSGNHNMLEREQYRYVMRCIEEPPFALHQSCKPLSRPSARTTSCFLGRLLHETCSLGLWKIFSGLVRYRANPCTTSIVLARVPIRRAAVDTSQDRSSGFCFRDVGAMDLVTFLCAMQNSGRDSHFLKSPGPVCSPLPLSAHNPFRNIR